MKSEGKYQKNRIFILNDNHALRINIELAEEIGLNESIVLLQTEYLLGITDNVVDGRKWTYNSAQDLKDKYFSFWSISTIRRTLDSLKAKKLIIEENYNKRKYDKTKWFALNLEELAKLKSIRIESAVQNEQSVVQNEQGEIQNEQRSEQDEQHREQNEQPIPKTTTEISSNNGYIFFTCKNEIFAKYNFFRDEKEVSESEKKYLDSSVKIGDVMIYANMDDGQGFCSHNVSGSTLAIIVSKIINRKISKINASPKTLWDVPAQIKAVEDMLSNPNFGLNRIEKLIWFQEEADVDNKDGFQHLYPVDADTPIRIRNEAKRIEDFDRKKWRGDAYNEWFEKTYPELFESYDSEGDELITTSPRHINADGTEREFPDVDIECYLKK